MIRGLGDYKKEEKKGKKTESYAGGEKSGIAVENDDIESIVQKARTAGRSDDLEKDKSGKPKTELRIKLYSNGF
jgi:UBX domain-containing protein 1